MTTQVWSTFAIAGIVFLLLGAGLVSCVASLVRGNRNDVLASMPLASEQQVTVPSQGEVLVVIETPRTKLDYRAFQIQFVDRKTGQAANMAYSLMTAQGAVYGVTTMQVPFGRMNARAGVYSARIAGLQPGNDYSDYRLILSRPYMGRMVRQIIGIVLCGVGMLLTVIGAAWKAGLMKPPQG
jgi:hypothetical protein